MTICALIEELKAAEPVPAVWEHVYSRSDVSFSGRDAYDHYRVNPSVLAEWVAVRSDAGPCGTPLPEPKQACVKAMRQPANLTCADAYVLAITPGNQDAALPANQVAPILFNSAVAALNCEGNLLVRKLAELTGLASVVAGQPQLGWRLIDLLADGFSFGDSFRFQTVFGPIRGNSDLETSPWVRKAAQRDWRRVARQTRFTELEAPGVQLPTGPLSPFLVELRDVGASALADIVTQELNDEVVGRLDEEPFIHLLKQRAMQTDALELKFEPKDVPTGFVGWAKDLAQSMPKYPYLCREVAYVLKKLGEGQLAACLVLMACRARDLELLFDGMPQLESKLQGLLDVREQLDEELADAFVALAVTEHHVDREQAMTVVESRTQELHALDDLDDQLVRHIVKTARQFRRTDQKILDAASEEIETMFRAVERLKEALLIRSRVRPADLFRAASQVPLPSTVRSFPPSFFINLGATDQWTGLVVSAAIRLLVGPAKPDLPISICSTKLAADAIGQLEQPLLLRFRIELLEELLQLAPPGSPRIDMKWKLANTFFQLDENRRAAEILQELLEESITASDMELAIRSLRLEVQILLGGSFDAVTKDRLWALKEQVKELRELDMNDSARAGLEHAAGLVFGALGERELSCSALEKSLSLHLTGTIGWWDVASAYVSEVARTDAARAMKLGREFLSTSNSAEHRYQVGHVHLAVGRTANVSREFEVAQKHLERALELLRGRDPRSETNVRICLANTFISIGELDRARLHLAEAEAEVLPFSPSMLGEYLQASAFCAYGSGDLQQALACIQRMVEHPEERYSRLGVQLQGQFLSGTSLGQTPRGSRSESQERPGAGGFRQVITSTHRELRGELDSQSPVLQNLLDSLERLEEYPSVAPDDEPRRIAESSLLREAYLVALASLGNQPATNADASQSRIVRLLIGYQDVSRKLSEARTGRPDSCSESVWMEWKQALTAGNYAGLMRALSAVRREAPGFLRSGPDSLSRTTRWLSESEKSIAISADWDRKREVLAVCWLASNETGSLEQPTLGKRALPLSMMPVDSLASRGEIPSSNRATKITAASRQVAKLLNEVIPALLTAERVLWNPGPNLRTLMPTELFPNKSVAVTAHLSLPSRTDEPGRRPTSLVCIADPSGSNSPGLDGFIQGPVRRLAGYLVESERPPRVSASIAEMTAESIFPDLDAVSGPASPAFLLSEARNHELIIILAHGELSVDGGAKIALAAADGTREDLTLELLLESPESFAGADVVMLSCETGQLTGIGQHGGVAGALISAGARSVVAPIWPVRLSVAFEVASSVARGLADGKWPYEALSKIGAQEESGPSLGRAPTDASAQSQAQSFVCWVG